jgi:uncharacterized protein involved in exopolysaccharide biosynthesis
MQEKIISDEIDLGPYIDSFWSMRWILVGLSILGAATGFGLSYLVEPKYQVQSSWLTESSSTNSNLSALAALAGMGSLGSTGEEKLSYETILASPAFWDRLILQPVRKKNQQAKPILQWITEENPVLNGPDWLSPDQQRQRLAQAALQGAIEVKEQKGVQSLVITSTDPIWAYDLNLAVLEQFRWFNETRRRSRAMRQLEFVQARLTEFEQRLRQAEDSLLHFRKRNTVVVAPELMLAQQRLGREVEVQATLSMEFRKQLELLRIESVKEKFVLQPVIDPVLPERKSSPKRIYFLIGGGILTFAFALGLLLIWVFQKNRRMRSLES